MKKGIVLIALTVIAIAVLATGCRNNSNADVTGIGAAPEVTAVPISNVPPTTMPTTQAATETVSERVSEAASGMKEAAKDDLRGMSEAASDMAKGMRNAGNDLANGMRDVGKDLQDGFDSAAGTPGAGITDSMDEMLATTTDKRS